MTFSVGDALEIQLTQVKRWEPKLRPEYFKALITHVAEQNLKLTDTSKGSDVFRGQSIDSFVNNVEIK